MKKRQLHRIPDLLQLVLQSADVLIIDIGHFFQYQFFRLGPRQLFDDIAGARIIEQMVADAQSFDQQRVTEFCNLFFVEMQRHQGTVPSSTSLSRTTSPWISKPLTSMTFNASFRITSCPLRIAFPLIDGCRLTFIFRPET